MVTCSSEYPDLEDFIRYKVDNPDMYGCNISVKVSHEFMRNTKNNPLWKVLVDQTWKSGDPGLLFMDKIIEESPADCYPGYETKSTNPCQPGFASILTMDGIKKLEDINIGDLIWSKEGWTEVVNKWNNGVKPVFNYETTCGRFVGTENHKIVLDGKKIEVKDTDFLEIITTDDNYYVPEFDITTIIDGLMIGDGSIHPSSLHKVYLTIGENDTDYFKDKINNNIIGRHAVKYNAYKVITTIEMDELPVLPERIIPDRFYYGNLKTVVSFLRGLYSANGSVINNRVTLKSTSLKLIQQVQEMLNSIGILSYYTTNKERNTEWYNGTYISKQSYDLNISTDRDKFHKYIGFIQHYKNKKLESTLHKIGKTKIGNQPIISTEYLGDFEVFDIEVNNDSHTYWTGGINVSNCAELPLCYYGCCILGSVNLTSYVKDSWKKYSTIDLYNLRQDVIKMYRLMDDLVDLELEKIQLIIDKIKSDPEPDELKQTEINLWMNIYSTLYNTRRTGFGFTGLADVFAMLGKEYGNIDIADAIISAISEGVYESSIILAEERGCFPVWEFNKEKNNPFIKRMFTALYKHDQRIIEMYKKNGRRNISSLTVAPTGSLSLLTMTSSGVEPIFAPYYIRKRKVNTPTPNSFTDEFGIYWEKYAVIHPNFKEWIQYTGRHDFTDELEEEELNIFFKESPYYNQTAHDIDYKVKLKMIGKLNQKIDHSISHTQNVHENTTREEISDILLYAYRYGCKGISVFRNNCKAGIFNTKESNFNQHDAPKRPKELSCDIYTVVADKVKWSVIVGLYEGKPYEIFALPYRDNLRGYTKGIVKKIKSGIYHILLPDGSISENIVEKLDENQAAITRLASLGLRTGAYVIYVSETMSKKGSITSFNKALGRVLKLYIKEETVSTEKCIECGENLIYQEGCLKCTCGYSKC